MSEISSINDIGLIKKIKDYCQKVDESGLESKKQLEVAVVASKRAHETLSPRIKLEDLSE